MKIIDENGAAIENPDLTLGYLVDDTEPVEHPAVEGVEEVSHYETVTEYPGGGRDVRKVIDAGRACAGRMDRTGAGAEIHPLYGRRIGRAGKRAPAGRGSSPSARDDCQPDLPADRPAAGPV
ncbi:hypothetical protein HMPREF9436_00406 [Faecalibacterium cf. prausnitzii KLE1255]|uniref:Uncharacterized protein n=1 Tax=Faecalibacterium cf. prausnitzii KLE1255 TaxID=748224 RepID=E2ZFH3_9FIRM|nr:hypothetical protein [Faecalibacterium prausnitzii]EFQ08130.1 hypothetical protein HMPREF9436_00406 [Faecalibacterium cf. prausnitzii KLE1255]